MSDKKNGHKELWKKINRTLKEIENKKQGTIMTSVETSTNYILACANKDYCPLN